MSTEEGEAFAKEKKFLFQEVSAKTGENIGTLFNKDIADHVLSRFLAKDKEPEAEYGQGKQGKDFIK